MSRQVAARERRRPGDTQVQEIERVNTQPMKMIEQTIPTKTIMYGPPEGCCVFESIEPIQIQPSGDQGPRRERPEDHHRDHHAGSRPADGPMSPNPLLHNRQGTQPASCSTSLPRCAGWRRWPREGSTSRSRVSGSRCASWSDGRGDDLARESRALLPQPGGFEGLTAVEEDPNALNPAASEVVDVPGGVLNWDATNAPGTGHLHERQDLIWADCLQMLNDNLEVGGCVADVGEEPPDPLGAVIRPATSATGVTSWTSSVQQARYPSISR